MFLYQREHSIYEDKVSIEQNSNFSFPSHLHRSYECICIVEGEMDIEVDSIKKRLTKGECALVFPNQIHSLETPADCKSKHSLIIFPPEIVPYFQKNVEFRYPSTPFFVIREELIPIFQSLTDSSGTLAIKGLLYSLLSDYVRQCPLTDTPFGRNQSVSVVKTILQYTEDNFKTECTLSNLSDALGYDYSYVSKLFTRQIGMSFCSYINSLRINYACSLLTNSNESILDIAILSGFHSLRSFNRNFIIQKGCTPSEYKNQSRKNELRE